MILLQAKCEITGNFFVNNKKTCHKFKMKVYCLYQPSFKIINMILLNF